MIEANLQQIQIKMESSHDQLKKEVELLRKKVETEQEQYRESVRTWELANKELKEKSEAAVTGEKAAIEQLSTMSTMLETMKEELKDSTEQL
jgi:hypothetical protein